MHISVNRIIKAAGLLLLAGAVCSGCASTGVEQRPPIDKSRVFIASPDVVWTKLLETVTSGEETLSFVDKAGGIVTFQKNIPVKKLSQYAFDDSGMLMSQAVATVVMRVTAQDEESTKVVINTKINATGKDVLDVMLSRQRQVVLDSKGWLEREYFELLDKKMQQAAAPGSQSLKP